MLNKVVLIGRLTKDPTLMKTPTNKSVVRFILAVPKDEKKTDFVACVAWEKVAESLATYQHKGSLIAVSGRLSTRDYQDSDGKKIYVTEVVSEKIVFLEKKDGSIQPYNSVESEEESSYMNVSSDDLPF